MYNSQEIAERIRVIAKYKNIPIRKMLEKCELSKNTLSSMLSGGSMPKSDNLAKIADYLECSVDYLLGRTDKPTAEQLKLQSAVVSDSAIENWTIVINGTEYQLIPRKRKNVESGEQLDNQP